MLDPSEFEKNWKEWSSEEETNYKIVKTKSGVNKREYLKKGYLHLDSKFWFPERKNELKSLLKNGLKFYNKFHRQFEWWSFKPFLKIIAKTPRFKFDAENKVYKKKHKKRPICFACHLDSLIFGFYSYVLTKKYEIYIQENGFCECPLAYRTNLNSNCNIQFAKEIFDEIKVRGECTAIGLDIRGYFDNISHEILKIKWCKILKSDLPEDQFRLYNYLTKYSYIKKDSLLKKYNINLKKIKHSVSNLLELVPGIKDIDKFKDIKRNNLIVQNESNKGIPQGSALSSVLSNIYLIDFDQDLFSKSKNEGFLYRRYCDDIVVICNSNDADRLQKYMINLISGDNCKLEIQPSKIELIEFKKDSKGRIRSFNKKKIIQDNILLTDTSNERKYFKSFQYLGFEFDGKSIRIRSSSLSKYFRKMKARIYKTLTMAYGSHSNSINIWQEQLLHRYTHLGKRNFISYAYNAASAQYLNSKNELKLGLNSIAIKRQVARHMSILIDTLSAKNIGFFLSKKSKGKLGTLKKI